MIEHGGWTFNELDAEAFQAHIESSIPGYSEGHQYITYLSDYFVSNHSLVYDLGCSNGTLIKKLASYHAAKEHVRFHGIDVAETLLEENAQAVTDQAEPKNRIQFEVGNIESKNLEPCDLVIMYYTLQFIAADRRQALLNKIYQSLKPGGALFLFEKVLAPQPRFQDMFSTTYLEYKKNNGFSGNDIVDKLLSLKGVLDPFTSAENQGLLRHAGFEEMITVFKFLCFEGVLAMKLYA